MKINEEQFNSEIAKYKDTHLDQSTKDLIKSKLMVHADSYRPPVKSPYFASWHLSYKMVSFVVVLVLCVSVGTTYASQNSLPGELLYPIKTKVAEPILKLTKRTPKEKVEFDLSLADKRIQEVEELIKEDKITEAKLERNLFLFEKHLDEREKDRENRTKSEPGTSVLMQVGGEIDINTKREKDESDDRIDRYRELMNSKPDLNNFYENKAKLKLEKRMKRLESRREQEAREEMRETKPEESKEDPEINPEDKEKIEIKQEVENEEELEVNREIEVRESIENRVKIGL